MANANNQRVILVGRGTDGEYYELGVTSDGKLTVGGISISGITIGSVDQGTGGVSAWKVDGSGVTQPISAAVLGLITGAAVITDADGSVQQYLRGLIKILADIYSAANHNIKVNQGLLTASDVVTIVDGGSSIGVDDNGGSLTTDTAGDVAHDGVDSGNPVKIGGVASLVTAPAAVSTALDRVNASLDGQGRQLVRTGHQALISDVFNIVHRPAANTQATITQSAAGAGKRLVATAINIVLAAGASAPSAVQTAVTLITDTAGAATELWSAVVALPATAGAMSGIVETGLWIPGASNKDLRLRFEAAGGANTIESIALSGVIVAE